MWYTTHIVLFAQFAHGGVTDRPSGRRGKDQTIPAGQVACCVEYCQCPAAQGHPVYLLCLGVLGRDCPGCGGEVNFCPCGVSDFAASGGGKGQEFESGDRCPMCIGCFDGSDLAAPTLLWGRAFMCWGRWVLEPRAAVMRSSAGLFSQNPWAMHHFMTAAILLFDTAGRFGFCVPYGGETGHDIGGRDLVHPFFSQGEDRRRCGGLTASALRTCLLVSTWRREAGLPVRSPGERWVPCGGRGLWPSAMAWRFRRARRRASASVTAG